MRSLVLCAVLVVCAVLAVPAEFIVDLGISWNRAVVEQHFTQESTTQNDITKKKKQTPFGRGPGSPCGSRLELRTPVEQHFMHLFVSRSLRCKNTVRKSALVLPAVVIPAVLGKALHQTFFHSRTSYWLQQT